MEWDRTKMLTQRAEPRETAMKAPPADALPSSGVSIEARGLYKSVRGDIPVLQDVSLSLAAGELVAIVGGSGAGKTTLLEALAGIAPADRGRVLFDGVDLYADREAFRSVLGYVPQDDIIHLDLPLERTLRYAARLRLPAGTAPAEMERRVQGVLRDLKLAERAGTAVGVLSGGQRKRASIAVEMLTDPRVFFLDEPTSGLDPATGAELLDTLRGLADRGATVIFTTHAIEDLARCDRVVFLATGGRLAFVGTVPEALAHFGVSSVSEIYRYLGARAGGHAGARSTSAEATTTSRIGRAPVDRRPPGPLRQWLVLTQRTFESLARNPLTLAILVGSPAMVVAMFAILFNAGAFDFANPSPTSILMIVFWITFGAFFFGLTYGLLQIVTERAILRREYLVGLRLSSYLLSKLAVLLPFLLIVNLMMLVVLRALDRLPDADLIAYVSVCLTLTLDALAALTLGLLASAAVSNAAQGTLVLPMLCFPAVLFSGAILPVHVMAEVGRWISTLVPCGGPSRPSGATSRFASSSSKEDPRSARRSWRPMGQRASSRPPRTGSTWPASRSCSSSARGWSSKGD